MNTPPELSVAQHAAWLDHKLAVRAAPAEQRTPRHARAPGVRPRARHGAPRRPRRAVHRQRHPDRLDPLRRRAHNHSQARCTEVLPAVELAILEDHIARPLALFEVEQVTRPSALVCATSPRGTRRRDRSARGRRLPARRSLLARLGLVGGVLTTVGQPLVERTRWERALELVNRTADGVRDGGLVRRAHDPGLTARVTSGKVKIGTVTSARHVCASPGRVAPHVEPDLGADIEPEPARPVLSMRIAASRSSSRRLRRRRHACRGCRGSSADRATGRAAPPCS